LRRWAKAVRLLVLDGHGKIGCVPVTVSPVPDVSIVG